MSINIKTNVTANNALNQLNRTTRDLSRNFEHISSGLRISRAADDAAGLGVAENLRSIHSSADVAIRNVNDGISVISVAEGATNEVSTILIRLRELAIQSASQTLADTERSYIQTETDQLVSEIDRIANVTEFNGVSLSNGTTTAIAVQVGVRNTSNDQITIMLGDMTTTALNVTSLNLSTSTAALAAITTLDTALDSVGSVRSGYGAVENRLNSALNNLEAFSEASKAAESRIRDADFGAETAQLSQHQILQQAGVSVLSQAKNLSSAAVNLLNS